MKKILFLSMVLLACPAFSPPAFAAPDTGPKVDNIEVVNVSASADLIMPEEGVFQVSITDNHFSTYVQASGRETVLLRSDHSVDILHFSVNNKYGSDLDVYIGGERIPWCTSTGQTKLSPHFGSSGHFGSSSAALHEGQMTLKQKLLWTQVPAWCRRY